MGPFCLDGDQALSSSKIVFHINRHTSSIKKSRTKKKRRKLCHCLEKTLKFNQCSFCHGVYTYTARLMQKNSD